MAVAPPQAPAAAGSGERIGEVEFDECAVKAVHLGFFDPLEEAGYINGSTGRIAKRIEDYVDGFAVGDMLREALIGEGEEAYDLFDAEARAEFLFRLVGHLALGGPLNQYEDSWSPYAATAKVRCSYGSMRCMPGGERSTFCLTVRGSHKGSLQGHAAGAPRQGRLRCARGRQPSV